MDLVIYEQKTKMIVTIVLDLKEEPKFLMNTDYVGLYIDHNDYRIIDADDGKAYFENLREKILYLDDYRGRYKE